MTQPTPRFTGIFIPVEIMEIEGLTLFEERLLSIIDSLYCSDHGGCFASNEYLAEKMKNVKPNTIAKALTKLRKMELIEDISFDGRKRVIRACIGRHVDREQSSHHPANGSQSGPSNDALEKNPTLGWKKIQPPVGEKSKEVTPCHIYDSKDERKDEYIARTTPSPRQVVPIISFSFDAQNFENITEQDVKTWSQLYPSVDVKRELLEMIEWIKSNPSKAKSKKLWRKFIMGWLQRQNEKLVNQLAYQNLKEKQVSSRHTGLNKDPRPMNPKRVFDFSHDI